MANVSSISVFIRPGEKARSKLAHWEYQAGSIGTPENGYYTLDVYTPDSTQITFYADDLDSLRAILTPAATIEHPACREVWEQEVHDGPA